MPPYRVLVGYQIREAILANYKPQHVVVPDVRIDVSFDDPTGKLGTAFMADPLLHQKMVNRIQQLAKGDLAKLMASRVAMTDLNIRDATAAGNMKMVAHHAGNLEAGLNEIKRQILPKISQAGTDVVAELAATRKEYRGYKMSAALSISLGVVGIGMGVATMAASGGGSSLLSLIAIARSVSEILQQCVSLYADAEKTGTRVHGSILSSLKTKSDNKDINALLEVGRAAVKALTTVDLVATPARCAELNGVFDMKIKGLNVKSHDAAIELNKSLQGVDALIQSMRPHNLEVVTKLEAAEIKTQLLIQQVMELNRRVEVGEMQHAFYREIITAMQRGVAAWGAVAAVATKLVLNIGIGLAGGAGAGAIDGSAFGGLPFAQAASSAQEGATGAAKVVLEAASSALDLYGYYGEIAGLFGSETLDEVRAAYPDLVTTQHRMPPPPIPVRPNRPVPMAPPPLPPRPSGGPPPLPPRGGVNPPPLPPKPPRR